MQETKWTKRRRVRGYMKEVERRNRLQMRAYVIRKRNERGQDHDFLSTMKNPDNVVEFDNLKTYFFTDSGTVKAVDGVTFSVPRGKTVGVVGESGCGKSVTSLSLMRLLQEPAGQIVEGEIRYNNGTRTVDIARTPEDQMQTIRGNEIAMIFQEPMTSLNPVFTIGYQVDEAIALHNPDMDKAAVRIRSVEMLKMVGIARPEGIYRAYPHELSGGMRQRVMIAMALACDPKLIVADEPTTALDVTVQAQILDLMRHLKNQISASIMLITHDLGVVAEMADEVVVMYAGRIVEKGTAVDIFHNPLHPYTVGLLRSKPSVNRLTERLYSIPGQVPNPIDMPDYCYFKPRCERSIAKCDGEYPPMIRVSETHEVACWLHEKEGTPHA